MVKAALKENYKGWRLDGASGPKGTFVAWIRILAHCPLLTAHGWGISLMPGH